MKWNAVLVLLSVWVGLSSTAQALQFMKCSSEDGKTFWASFGKRKTSGNPLPVYFPTEIVVFSGAELQSRVFYERTVDALKIKVTVNPGKVKVAFPVTTAEGERINYVLDVGIFSPAKSATAYSGLWISIKDNGAFEADSKRAACSVY